ncbi:2-dehydro-3-deoxy-D-gluconate 5-dehydrogenase KduD [Longimicrobium terrae]|uniref:2-deoxy-D-gluconate 3-dehydrogenase n=1 Tax=Longimicrobium terrae TaxID=1639882 RepID=A0A841H7L1_9BACT|nr:2-dehydro-3-deoxy-D-gluconate 5-dehydrogenase KduD [Longimicrobium terrae]MBB4639533.1 2-deoxy-D-gluconate 3-dehydrogenase [Longimicrobium terrae]MBB6073904.1 2-deoxy-D-gluconate 3-dehydrogenase [Longimicrobium terrae]NNC32478.1 2-dehydro-3-deoxy-D-gluconate 5-dehydrogenase KduD [Longimicrobium terrae]
MSGMFRLDGRRAVVTGAGAGLGRGMAIGLAAAGADVVCVDRDAEGVHTTAAAIRDAGSQAWALTADLSDRDALHAMADEAESAAGQIDILVNNAGTIRRHPAVEFPDEAWDAVMAINLDAPFLLSRRFGRGMVERGRGKIINVASLLAFQGGILVPSYTASKHAVAGLTKALANEWAGRGVNVNALAPGYMATANTAPLRADPVRTEAILGRIPAGRWGEPEDLAGAAVFLASPASDYVNGHVLVVDGGWMAR